MLSSCVYGPCFLNAALKIGCMTSRSDPPALGISIVSSLQLAATPRYDVTWRIENEGSEEIEIEESWLPHGQFRASRETFDPPLILPARNSALHRRSVDVVVEPGRVVENAFLILRARYAGDAWRVFVRMKIEAAPDSGMRPIVEAVTTSPIQA
jgi:hypothetical protein